MMHDILATFEPKTWALIGLAFFVAGVVKGVVGQGLPSVVLAILTVVIGLKPAIALLLVPAFVTNIWQAFDGRAMVFIVRRIWTLLLAVFAGAWLGVSLLATIDPRLMAIFMGTTLAVYGLTGLARPHFPSPARHHVWMAPIVGVINGVLAGMTGQFGIPGVPYMQALGFDKNTLVQGMGIVFSVSIVAVAIAMSDYRLLSPELALASTGGIIPALAGMWAGQRVRHRLSEQAFKRTLFCALIAIGAFIVWRAM